MKAKYIALIILLSLSFIPLSAQDDLQAPANERSENPLPPREGVEVGLGVDLVNQYIWRGQDLGDVSLQPTLGVSWKGLSLSAWGNVGISDFSDDKEVDLTLGYNIAGFNVGITDYWFSQGSYFQYKSGKTTHLWEANIGYDFGFLNVQWFTNFAGDDGLNNDGKRAYSSYLQLSAPFRLATLDWTATLGVVPYATTSYNANGFCITDISLRATKDFVIREKYHLPVFAGLTANPRSEKVYFLFGVSFSM